MACLFGHKWEGCKCKKCGETRNEYHEWDGCKCTKCGKTRDEQHTWDGHRCSCCGKTIKDEDVKKITDQEILADIAQHNKDFYVCFAAIEKLIDQFTLEKIARSDNYYELRNVAVGKLTSKSVLTELANTISEKSLKFYSFVPDVYKNDKRLLCKIAKERLEYLTCEEICNGHHNWKHIRTDHEHSGETRYFYNIYKCVKCGMERTEDGGSTKD